MKITNIKSICCGKSVLPLPRKKWNEDKVYLCPKCNEPCEAFYCTEVEED